MHTVGDLSHRPDPIAPECACATALARFMADPMMVMLPVVEDGRPVGALSRQSFLTRMETPGAADRAVAELMDPSPVTAHIGEGARRVVRRLTQRSPGALLAGFLIVDDAGRYQGVASALDLLSLRRSRIASPQKPLARRFCAAVREPVSRILTSLEGGAAASPEGRNALASALEAGREVMLLLDAAMALSLGGDESLTLIPQAVRLEELLEEIELHWRAAAERRSVTLLVSYDGAPDFVVEVDRTRIMQVLDPLIAHALAQCRQGVVEVSVRARRVDTGVELDCRIRDNGPRPAGADPNDMFDPAAGDDVGGDFGARLGLALAASIAASIGGRLTARANAGPGVTRQFEVIVAAAKELVAEDISARAGPQRMAHVLVVEDNATNRMVIETLCEMLGCTSESVVDGVEGVEAARSGRFDLVLMDIKMPRMDGLTATAEIRKLPGRVAATPIVALTANADPADVRRYLAAGMCCVVEKPIKTDRFAEAIAQALAADPPATRKAAAA